MKRSRIAGLVASLAALLCIVVLICAAVPAQSHSRDAGQERGARSIRRPSDSHGPRREFAPRIIGRANSFIVNGHIVALRGQRLSLETAEGTRLDFQLDEQTTLLTSSEVVSIATMDDITLRPADLRLDDEVEVVAERAGGRAFARIVTRTASGQPVARR
ncbi:MAG TPA: hypothetical protein VJZ91_01260 [Blastocatellia bacterium]|nr:hypothetical protein [Blastocatellia bacterium]